MKNKICFKPVSYTHLDVYKRQTLMGLCHHIAVTMSAEKQCCRTNNLKVQESRNDLKKKIEILQLWKTWSSTGRLLGEEDTERRE